MHALPMTITDDAALGAEAEALKLALDDERTAQAELDLECEALKQMARTPEARTLAVSLAIGDYNGEPRHAEAEVQEWIDRAHAKGCGTPRMVPDTVEKVYRSELVPNAPLRAAYEALQADGDERGVLARIAKRLGAVKGAKPDVSWAERLLGIEPTPTDDKPSMRVFVTYEQAVAIADVLDLDPLDVGI